MQNFISITLFSGNVPVKDHERIALENADKVGKS